MCLGNDKVPEIEDDSNDAALLELLSLYAPSIVVAQMVSANTLVLGASVKDDADCTSYVMPKLA